MGGGIQYLMSYVELDFLVTQFCLSKHLCSCMQGTQRGSGTSHSSSSSQLGSSPKLERKQRTGLHRTVAAVGQTEPAVIRQANSAGFDSATLCTAAKISKPSPLKTESISLECDSPKDQDFPPDFHISSSRTDVGSAVQNFAAGCGGSSSHLVFSVHENGQPSAYKPASYCKLHRQKPGRRPQSASDIDHCRSAADCRYIGSSESMSVLEERFNKTLEMNMKLAEKLATTCQQMEVLTVKLRKFEVSYAEFYHITFAVGLL